MIEPDQPDQSAPERDEAAERAEAHNLARQGQTKCMTCKKVFDTDEMTVFRVEFRPAVKRDRVQSRTVGKLCPNCLKEHPLWNLPTKYV